MLKQTLDKFSDNSENYRKYRPVYPKSLYDTIYNHVSNFDCAWDCGTGNGQVANILSQKFRKIIATDISDEQLKNAVNKSNIIYKKERAESTRFGSNEFDLITIAQAIHWFDIREFSREASRVLKPNGILAYWGYGLIRISADIDKLIDDFYWNRIHSYWNTERRHIENQYKSIVLPEFEVIKAYENEFKIKDSWTVSQLMGYLNSWSSVANYIKDCGNPSPVNKLMENKLFKNQNLNIQFPLFLYILKSVNRT